MVDGFNVDNLMKCIMHSLLQGGMVNFFVITKMIAFVVDGVNIFQGLKFGVTIQVCESWAPFNLGMHCVSHHNNLAMQNLFVFPLVLQLKELFQDL
jgi:hypothetical protein